MAKSIVMYTARMCADCEFLKAYMDERNIAYELRDIRENSAYAEEVEAKTGKQGVPYLVIDGQWVRGYQPGMPFSTAFADTLFA